MDNTPTDTLEVMEILPAADAFVSGTLELPSEPTLTDYAANDTSLTGIVLSALSLVFILILFKKIVNIVPSLIACVLRWKESVNLEASVKMSSDRTIIAAAMIIPFCLVVEHFEIYSPKYMTELSETWRIVAIAATMIVYFATRALAGLICKPAKSSNHAYSAGYKSEWTFFILLTLLLLCAGGISSFANLDFEATKVAMLWISGVIYLFLLLREYQIFASSCSFITAFLYLCALEIVPSGLLVGSVFIF